MCVFVENKVVGRVNTFVICDAKLSVECSIHTPFNLWN